MSKLATVLYSRTRHGNEAGFVVIAAAAVERLVRDVRCALLRRPANEAQLPATLRGVSPYSLELRRELLPVVEAAARRDPRAAPHPGTDCTAQ